VENYSGKHHILLNGNDVTDRLRDNKVSSLVSSISSQKIIREKMVTIQRDLSKNKSIVMDGRDIGTVVFPNANFKFFLTASIESRALRRYKELDKSINLEIIKEEIVERDYLDSTRFHSPLKKANDAIIVDTTHLTISEQVSMILEIITN
jgi:cytidylate kinase